MGVVKKGARNEGDDGGWETSPEGDSRGIRAVVETVARQTARSHFPACHNIHYAAAQWSRYVV